MCLQYEFLLLADPKITIPGMTSPAQHTAWLGYKTWHTLQTDLQQQYVVRCIVATAQGSRRAMIVVNMIVELQPGRIAQVLVC